MWYLEAVCGTRTARWPLPPGGAVVGRDPACECALDEPLLSRRHVRVTPADQGFEVEDLGSRNGTWVDGERIARASLRVDQWFAAGNVLLAVRRGLTLVPDSDHPSDAPVARDPLDRTGGGARDGDALGELASALDADDDDGPARAERLLRWVAGVAPGFAAALLETDPDDPRRWTMLASAGPVRLEELLRPGAEAAGSLWLNASRRIRAHRIVVQPAADLDAVLAADRARVAAALWDGRRATDADAVTAADAERTPVAAPPEGPAGETFITESSSCRRVLNELDRLARSDLPVLLRGESGTGKELLARRVHERSRRAAGPYIALNCTAIPDDQLEAELFGIVKRAATGVDARTGRFAAASGGTLFLDEVGDLPSSLQPKLLRALESGEVLPIGAPAPVRVDVRLVAATHRDLHADVAAGRFRQDLLFRIAGATLEIPPLRERPEDVLPLVRRFATREARAHGRAFRGLELEAARLLLGHSWPGNVRELRHAVTRAVTLAHGTVIGPDALPAEIRGQSDAARGDILLALHEEFRAARARFERLYFERLLLACDGNRAEAARRAGLSRSALYEKLAELGIA